MDGLFPLLEKIKAKPGLYIGTAAITNLRMFLLGYRFAKSEIGVASTDTESDFYKNFQPWLQTRLSVRTVNSWDKIILLNYHRTSSIIPQQLKTLMDHPPVLGAFLPVAVIAAALAQAEIRLAQPVAAPALSTAPIPQMSETDRHPDGKLPGNLASIQTGFPTVD